MTATSLLEFIRVEGQCRAPSVHACHKLGHLVHLLWPRARCLVVGNHARALLRNRGLTLCGRCLRGCLRGSRRVLLRLLQELLREGKYGRRVVGLAKLCRRARFESGGLLARAPRLRRLRRLLLSLGVGGQRCSCETGARATAAGNEFVALPLARPLTVSRLLRVALQRTRAAPLLLPCHQHAHLPFALGRRGRVGLGLGSRLALLALLHALLHHNRRLLRVERA
mmetsp:Transcript_12927/g.32782  ORF Transcript_12927/g.32782 Transcript_12927/m.32782 type:complete len:225 (-) Transcript_12927:250-924(-)